VQWQTFLNIRIFTNVILGNLCYWDLRIDSRTKLWIEMFFARNEPFDKSGDYIGPRPWVGFGR
jgi:hypothetical protein